MGLNDKHLIDELYRDFLEDNTVFYGKNTSRFIEKLMLDFSKLEGYEVQLLHGDDGNRLKIIAADDKLSLEKLHNDFNKSISSYSESEDYVTQMPTGLQIMYQIYQESLNYNGRFGLSFKVGDNGKLMLSCKTDIENMIRMLEISGFQVQNGKAKVEIQQKLVNDNEKENEEILPGNPIKDSYEKLIQNEKGEDVLVRMDVIKQNKEDSKYERVINVSHENLETGKVETKDVFGYEDGKDFDNNILPKFDTLKKNENNSGLEVDVLETEDNNMWITEEDESYSSKYSVNDTDSILELDNDGELTGDENEIVQQEGKVYVKTLGTVPVNSSYEDSGFSTYFNLALFLLIDVVAIAVGLFLLMR